MNIEILIPDGKTKAMVIVDNYAPRLKKDTIGYIDGYMSTEQNDLAMFVDCGTKLITAVQIHHLKVCLSERQVP